MSGFPERRPPTFEEILATPEKVTGHVVGDSGSVGEGSPPFRWTWGAR